MTNLTSAGVTYTYNTPGLYSVTEIVTGPGGSSTSTASNYVTVSGTSPGSPYVSRYVFGVNSNQLTLNGHPFKILGLRCANAQISDATTSQLISNLDVFKSYGVNTITVYVMGSRFGDIQGYHRTTRWTRRILLAWARSSKPLTHGEWSSSWAASTGAPH